MIETKEKIVIEAKRLFDENGYDQVSLRGIAKAAGTTIGNLTYHFPQKEALIEEIQRDIQVFFLHEMNAAIDNGCYSLEGLVHLLVTAQKGQESAPFYFSNMIKLCKDFDLIAKSTAIFRCGFFEYLVKCFNAIQAEGFMRKDIKPRQYETLAYIIVMMPTFQVQKYTPYFDPDLPSISLVQAAKDIFQAYFTTNGLNEFENIQLRYLHYDLPETPEVNHVGRCA